MTNIIKNLYNCLLQLWLFLVIVQFSACKEKMEVNQLPELLSSDFKLEEIGYGGFVGKSGAEYSFKQEKDSVLVIKRTLFVNSELLKRKITNQVYSNIKDEILCISKFSSPYINDKYSLEQLGRINYKLHNSRAEINMHIISPISCKLSELFIQNELQPDLSSN